MAPVAKVKTCSDIERKFVSAYLSNGFSITEAAITAGYAPQSANHHGGQVRWRPHVAQEIERRVKLAEDKADVKIAEVIREARLMALSDIGEVFEDDGDGLPKLRRWSNIPKRVTRGIRQIKIEPVLVGTGEDAQIAHRVTVTMHDKMGPLELLAKYLKIIGDKGGDTSNTLIVFQNALSRVDEVIKRVAAGGEDNGDTVVVPVRPVLSAPAYPEPE